MVSVAVVSVCHAIQNLPQPHTWVALGCNHAHASLLLLRCNVAVPHENVYGTHRRTYIRGDAGELLHRT